MRAKVPGVLPFPKKVKYDDCCRYGVCKHDADYAMCARMSKAFHDLAQPSLFDAFLFTVLGLPPQAVLVTLAVKAPEKFCVFLKCDLVAGLYSLATIKRGEDLPWIFALGTQEEPQCAFGCHFDFVHSLPFFMERRESRAYFTSA